MAGSGKAGVDGTAKRTSRTGVEGALRRLQRVRGPVKRQQDAQGATAARVGTAPLIHTHRFHQDPWLSATAASPHGPRRSRPNHCRCACERAVARRALAAALSVAGASDTQSPPVALAAEPPCGPRRRSGVLDVALTGPGALTGDASCTRGWWPAIAAPAPPPTDPERPRPRAADDAVGSAAGPPAPASAPAPTRRRVSLSRAAMSRDWRAPAASPRTSAARVSASAFASRARRLASEGPPCALAKPDVMALPVSMALTPDPTLELHG